jgi:hypothetical protein
MPRSWLDSLAWDPKILRPIAHRTVEQQEALTFDRRSCERPPTELLMQAVMDRANERRDRRSHWHS